MLEFAKIGKFQNFVKFKFSTYGMTWQIT